MQSNPNRRRASVKPAIPVFGVGRKETPKKDQDGDGMTTPNKRKTMALPKSAIVQKSN